MDEFEEHVRRYWQYQYDVARNHMAPLLERWGVRLNGASMLDVGCGTGGGTCAIHDLGARCVGYDINAHSIDKANDLKEGRSVSFSLADIYAQERPVESGSGYDLVVLHDVYEHLERKNEMMQKLKSYMKNDGKLLITFPPYYSAYGAHQQHMKASFAKLPFVHLVPFMVSTVVPRLKGEDPYIISEVTKLGRLKMGMRGFQSIAAKNKMSIIHKEAYIISPNHIRFGLKPIPAGPVAAIPILGEFLCSGVVYLLGKA